MKVSIELSGQHRDPRKQDMQDLINSVQALLDGKATGYHRDRAIDVMSILEGLKQGLPR